MAETKKQAESKAPAKDEAKPVVSRKRLTLEEKVAKAEAELRAAREQADKAAVKERTSLTEEKAKLVTKRDELSAKISEIDAKLERLQAQPNSGDPLAAANDRAEAASNAASEEG